MTPKSDKQLSRRSFLAATGMWLGVAACTTTQNSAKPRSNFPGDVGVNLSSFARQLRTKESDQSIAPFDLPRILRDELNIGVIDLPNTVLNTRDPRTLERFRNQAESNGCVVTNLKVNEKNLPFDGEDAVERSRALEEYKRWIDAAVVLGARWLRPFPANQKPRWERLVDGYRELADYAAPRGITLLIENYKWLETEPEVIPKLVNALLRRVAAQPDTGNWIDDSTRRVGLARSFPSAVSCDFKVLQLGPQSEHKAYDLRECFELGQAAGFRGPWCIEHTHPDRATLFRELHFITEQLRKWSKSPSRNAR